MRVPIRRLIALCCAPLLAVACAGSPRMDAANAAPYPPAACDDRAYAHADEFALPATRADDADALARRHGVGRRLARLGRWHDTAQGWSTLAVLLQSDEARSLSIHLRGLRLPPRTEIWWCGDGERHGPYRDAAGGELWSPVIRGGRGLLQVWTPSAARGGFDGELADVEGGLR